MAENLVSSVRKYLDAAPKAAKLLNFDATTPQNFAQLIEQLFWHLTGNAGIATLARDIFAANPALVRTAIRDIEETARRNFEPGGAAATFLFSRGTHATLAHRIAHDLWQSGDQTLALAVKSATGRLFATDIHPAARIGSGFWLDHGLGVVIGETSRIDEDVSIWHSVTLGSTLTNSGPDRHPKIGRGAVIGAGAMLLGNITIGAGANIAAGAIVVEDVPPATLMIGAKARNAGPASVSFTPDEPR